MENHILFSYPMHSALLFCGFKIIYSGLKHDSNFFTDRTIVRTVALDKESLEEKILGMEKISAEVFFKNVGLKEYHFSNYNSLFR